MEQLDDVTMLECELLNMRLDSYEMSRSHLECLSKVLRLHVEDPNLVRRNLEDKLARSTRLQSAKRQGLRSLLLSCESKEVMK